MKPYAYTVSTESQNWKETGQRPRDSRLLREWERDSKGVCSHCHDWAKQGQCHLCLQCWLLLLAFEQYGIGSSTKASFTPFVDPRVYQTSPTDEDEEDDESSAAGEQAWPWRFTDRHPFQYSPGTKPIKSRGYTIYGLQLPLPWS